MVFGLIECCFVRFFTEISIDPSSMDGSGRTLALCGIDLQVDCIKRTTFICAFQEPIYQLASRSEVLSICWLLLAHAHVCIMWNRSTSSDKYTSFICSFQEPIHQLVTISKLLFVDCFYPKLIPTLYGTDLPVKIALRILTLYTLFMSLLISW